MFVNVSTIIRTLLYDEIWVLTGLLGSVFFNLQRKKDCFTVVLLYVIVVYVLDHNIMYHGWLLFFVPGF